MIPIYLPPNDDDPDAQRRRAKIGVMFGVAVAALLALGLLAWRSASIPVIALIVLICVVITAITVLSLSQQPAAKRKRETDMYTLIDRMVDDLDDEELNYLRRRLAQRALDDEKRLPEELNATLDRRDAERKAGKR